MWRASCTGGALLGSGAGMVTGGVLTEGGMYDQRMVSFHEVKYWMRQMRRLLVLRSRRRSRRWCVGVGHIGVRKVTDGKKPAVRNRILKLGHEIQ